MTADHGPDHGDISGADLYRVAVEEYRFQAQFNWTRVQYLLAFNVAILAAGVALAPKSGALAISVFALGVLASGLTFLVHRVQHTYYRNARDRMRRVEQQYSVASSERLDTTATLKGTQRTISVTQVVYVLLCALLVANVVNIAIVLLS